MPSQAVSFVSTRRSSGSPPVDFGTALMRGLAPDGGLYIPTNVPPLPVLADDVAFAEMATQMLWPWMGGLSDYEDHQRRVTEAFNFPVPLVPLAGGDWAGIHVLELFHGPTLSFKDFGARAMARWMAAEQAQREGTLTILVATSGDTGSAVADGFAGIPQVQVVLLYPKGQVSPTQEQQLIVERPGVRALSVEGTFDDCQRLVKSAFTDPDLAGRGLSSANSINMGRLLPQMTYYVWASLQLRRQPVVFTVPSGNLGNLTGGVMACQGGLNVVRFIAAHNANDFFPGFLAGTHTDFHPSKQTHSNAMDVGAPSNFERLQALLPGAQLGQTIWGTSVADPDTLVTMRRVYEETGYVADPHTAVGLAAAQRYRTHANAKQPIVVLSTAHPAKFPATIAAALGQQPDVPERLAAYWDRPTTALGMAPRYAEFKAFLETCL